MENAVEHACTAPEQHIHWHLPIDGLAMTTIARQQQNKQRRKKNPQNHPSNDESAHTKTAENEMWAKCFLAMTQIARTCNRILNLKNSINCVRSLLCNNRNKSHCLIFCSLPSSGFVVVYTIYLISFFLVKTTRINTNSVCASVSI